MKQTKFGVHSALGLVSLCVASLMALPGHAADVYPQKAIQVVVPVGAGGDTDMNARIFGKYMEKELGQPIVVVNVKGGGGTIGMKKVLDAAPDGYTVLFFHGEAMIPKLAGLVDYGIEAFQVAGIGVLDDTTVLATHVITSYSIHYTKLYDDASRKRSSGCAVPYGRCTVEQRRAGRRLQWPRGIPSAHQRRR